MARKKAEAAEPDLQPQPLKLDKAPYRTETILTSWTDAEMRAIEALARRKGYRRLAPLVRELTLRAIALEEPSGSKKRR